jgi:uncharacterized protein DUF4184
MPFTLSHVAAVVPAYRPLARSHLFSAAVIGSMAPDFGVLLPESLARWQTHSAQALFSFCLPGGLLAWWLTQSLIKPAALEVLPDGAWARARAQHPPLLPGNLQTWLRAALGILLGAVTHLVWDAFTHEDARGVRMLALLDDFGPGFAGHSLRVYAWLQYGSSLLGLAVLMLALSIWLRHSPAPVPPPPRRIARPERIAWSAAYLLLPVLALAVSIVRQYAGGHPPWMSVSAIGRDAAAFLRGGVLALLAVSLALRLRLGARAAAGGTNAPAPRGSGP